MNQTKDFALFLRRKNMSENTIIAYETSVRCYLQHYPEVSISYLQEYKAYLLRHFAINTVNLRISGINSYLRYLRALNLLPQDFPEFALPSIKIQKRTFLDNIISQEDYESFKTCLKQDKQYFWYFIIRFMAATGARASELVQLKVEHLNLGYMDLYSKGGKIRRIYLPEILTMEILQWLGSRKIHTGFVFMNQQGKRITPRGISGQLKKLALRYEIDPSFIYPHSFRHRFAINFLEKFNDISLLADLMGHESIETTRIYLKRSSQEQRSFIDEVVVW